MKKVLLAIALFTSALTNAQCKPDEPKILVLGDSWAFFSWSNNSYNENMNRFGLSDLRAYSTSSLSVSGTQADNFFTPSRIDELTEALNDNPSIEYIHFSLGGNDILGTYHVNNSPNQNQQYYNTLMQEIKAGIDIIHNINPDLKILLAGYDYPNFEETIENFIIPSQHPFYDQWDDMGKPVASQLNAVLIEVSNLFIDSVAVWNNVEFVNNLGLMQNTYGQDTPLTVAPGGTYAAGSLNVPNGLPNYPSPTECLNFSGIDSFHLSNSAYEVFIKRHFKEFYWKELRAADTSIISNDQTLNGTISSTTFTQDSLTIGTNTSLVSFNTSTLDPQENIRDASIFLKRTNLIGDNLSDEKITLEIKSGHYGASTQLELDDYLAISDFVSEACTYGNVNDNDSWLRIDVPYTLLPYINKSGTTQFKITYSDAIGTNNFVFNNSTEVESQPILDIKYGGFSSLNSLKSESTNVYPNPFNVSLSVNSKTKIKEIKISDINGRLVKNIDIDNNLNVVINTTALKKGIYLVSVIDSNNRKIVKKVIK